MRFGKGPSSGMADLIRDILLDFAVFTALLFLFAYFHHVRVDRLTPTELAAAPAAAEASLPAETPAPPEMAEPDSLATPTPEPAATPIPNDLLSGRYAERFSDATVSDAAGYKSPWVSVTMERRTAYDSTYYVADIYIRDLSCLRAAVAQEYIDFNRMQALELARLTDSIVAISGDYFAFRKSGNLAVRNGREWIKKLPLVSDICVLYDDGVMETFSAQKRIDFDGIYDRGPYQIWCFGPELLVDGKPPKYFSSSVNSKNPRSAIGYYEPGHYCFVLVDGRQKGYSLGMTLMELAKVFEELGCTVAFNLDGGDTAVMAYRGEYMSHPDGTPRDVSDIIYIGEPLVG